jgi:hypothetical protein
VSGDFIVVVPGLKDEFMQAVAACGAAGRLLSLVSLGSLKRGAE